MCGRKLVLEATAESTIIQAGESDDKDKGWLLICLGRTKFTSTWRVGMPNFKQKIQLLKRNRKKPRVKKEKKNERIKKGNKIK